MKKYFSFAMVFIAMLAMVSVSGGCSDDDGVDYSTTIVAKSTLSLSKLGGTGHLPYEIQGVDNSIISATTNVDWISDFNYAEPGEVQFTYTALEEDVETRSGQITLSYEGAADVVVTVTQGGALTFELSIDPTTITTNGAKLQIVPSDESQTYICAFMTKEYIDSFASDEEFIEADLEYLQGLADQQGVDLSTILNIYLMTGSKTNTVSDLKANTTYYGYVYGCTSEGVVTSDLYKAEFTTGNVTITDLTFTVKYEQVNEDPYPDNNPYSVKITVTPSDLQAKWYFAAMNSYVFAVDEWTDDDYENEIQSGMREGGYELLQGEFSFMLKQALSSNIRVWGGNDYYIWFFGCDDAYNVNSEFQKETIRTGDIPVTDDCTFTVDVLNVAPQDCEIHITPSNPNTNYFIGMYPGPYQGSQGSVEKYGANACVERLLQRIDLGDLGDGNTPDWQTNAWVQRGEMTTKMGADQKWRIDPEHGYSIVIFGFDKFGHRSTEISVTNFTTPEYTAPENFTLDFEFSDIEMRSFTCKVTPSHDDVWYHVGLTSADNFDQYEDWRKFVDEIIHADGGGALAQYVGEEVLTSTCTPGTEYVSYGFAYADGMAQSDLSSARVTSKPLPRNMNATVSGTWQVYNGDELAARYPAAWKEYAGTQYVCVTQVKATSEETAHTWSLVHATRGGTLPLPDMLIFDYFENYPLQAIYKDAEYGRCSPPGVGPWGFFYAGQDATGAWGELMYEEIMLNNPDHQGDIDTAPTSGFEDHRYDKSGVSTVSKVNLSAPIRFSKASFMQIERERADHGKSSVLNAAPKKEVSDKLDFDVRAQLKAASEIVK